MEKRNPEWLNLDFISQCLQSKQIYGRFSVESFTAEPALAPGSNFGSYILRSAVQLKDKSKQEEKTVSLIIKCPLTQGSLTEIFSNILEVEPPFYYEFLPLGRKLLNRSFAPDYFLSPIRSVIVLEDLNKSGYSMAQKYKLLNFEQCRCFFKSAAEFHAMSFAVDKQNPDLIRSLGKERLFSDDDVLTKTNRNMIRYGLDIMAEKLSNYNGDQRILKILKECSTKLYELLVEAVKPNEQINILNQGDPWSTNMMFKYDKDGNAEEAKLLDFQGLRYASPVYDLMYFLYTSASLEVLKMRQTELFETYLQHFNGCLREMGLEEALTMYTMNDHASKLSPLVLMVSEIGPPLALKPTVVNMEGMYSRFREEYTPEDNPYEELYTESYCKNHLPGLIQQLDNAGVFCYLEKELRI